MSRSIRTHQSCRKVAVAIYAMIGIACLNGCGNSPTTVGPQKTKAWGQVTLDQSPLESGQIVFIDSQGESPRTYGAPILKGKYEIELTPGPKRVEISARLSESPAGDPGANMRELLPARYNAESTLTADVANNEKDLNFELTSGDGK